MELFKLMPWRRATSSSKRIYETRGVSGSRWLIIYFYIGLLILSGALQRPIGGDNLEGAMTDVVTVEDNARMAILGLVFYTVTGLLFVKFYRRINVATDAVPLLFVCLLALLSAVWSPTPGATISKSAGLIGCTLFSLLSFAIFSPKEIIGFLLRFFIVFVLFNFLLSLALPDYAYHDSSDFYSIHAGLLKATYNHKNSFARVLSLGLIILVTCRSLSVRSSYLHWITVGIGFFLLTQTGSAKTFISVPLAILIAYVLGKTSRGGGRAALVAIAVIAWLVFSISGLIDEIFSIVLQGLERDPTLSARTLIWAVAISTGLENPILGGGYGGGAWAGGVGNAIFQATGFDPGHSHNGFIQTFVELGLVGLIAVTYFLIRVIVRIFELSSRNNLEQYRLLVAWMVLFLTNNFAGSFMVQANDIYWFQMIFSAFLIRSFSKRVV